MRYALSLALLTSLMAVPASADDRHVPQSTLAALGLNDMQTLTDAEGAEVRGMSGNANAMAMGLSLVHGLLIDPATKSFVIGTDANAAMAAAHNFGHHFTFAQSAQNSNVALQLNVVTNMSHFQGHLIGAAGGHAFASSK